MQAVAAGTATRLGKRGADWYLKHCGRLPYFYIDRHRVLQGGWIPQLGNFQQRFPENMLAGGIYKNRDQHLPERPGRIWQEADLEYDGRSRGGKRIVFSNDGLIFVTYDHYNTFVEVV